MEKEKFEQGKEILIKLQTIEHMLLKIDMLKQGLSQNIQYAISFGNYAVLTKVNIDGNTLEISAETAFEFLELIEKKYIIQKPALEAEFEAL